MQQLDLVELVARKVPSLSIEETLGQAAACLAQAHAEIAVVFDSDRPVGIVSTYDLLALWEQQVSPSTRLAGYARAVPCLPAHAAWQDALFRLTEANSCGILILLDESGNFSGILTEEAFCHRLGMSHLSSAQSLLQSLRDSALKLKAVFNSTQVFLGLLEPDGRVIEINTAALTVVGAQLADVVDRPFWETPWWAHDRMLQERVRLAVGLAAKGEASGFEATHPSAGQSIIVDFRIRPIRDDEGVVRYLLPEGRDITSHRQIEATLSSEHAILRTVLNTIPDLIFYKDLDSAYLGCNKAFEKYFGKPESQIVGRTDFYFVDQATAEGYREKDREAMSSGGMRINEEWAQYPDGHQVLLETIKAPIRGAQGQVTGLLGISRDITQSRQAEVALRASDARYRQLFEHMTSGFALHEIILDPTGRPVDYRFLQVNPAFEIQVGFTAEQLVGHTVREVLPAVEDYWIEVYGNVALTGQAVSKESYAAGLGRWYSVHAFCPKKGQFAAIINNATERKVAENELRRQKAQLRAILDNFPFMVWLKDRESHFLAANFEMARVCGFNNPEEMAGKCDADFWPAEIAAQYRANDLWVMNTLERQMMEEPAGDTGRWMETFKTPILDETGALLGTAGFARDITKRKQVEEALRASQLHYQALLAASPVAVMELDSQGACVYVNQRYVEMTGFPFESAQHDGWMQGVHPDYLSELMLVKQACYASGAMGRVEYRHLRPDGKDVWVIGQGMPMKTPTGEITGIIVTLTDITERKEMENNLRLAASMYEASSEGIMVVDADNRIVSVNSAFSTLLGYEAAEVLGREPGELRANSNASSQYQSLWQTVDETGHWQGEIWNQRKNGEEIALWMTINTLRNRQGEVQWRFALFSDITERKRSEDMIWRQANYDPLTGLPNRRLFRDRLQQEIKRTQRSGHMLALFFIDLDRFKEVNDTLGHDSGDQLLIEAGERVCRCVRQSDTVARLGGDEFTVVLSDMVDQGRASEVALAVLQVLASPFLIDGHEASVSASIGIAFYPEDGMIDLDLLKQADRAMYFAKAKGRNCFATVNG